MNTSSRALITAVWLVLSSVSLPAYERLQGPTEVLYWDQTKTYAGYTLFGVRSNTYLINMDGRVVHTWPTGINPRLLTNGNILDASGGDLNGFTSLKELDWNGNTVWQYTETRTNYLLHHDFLRIYNARLGTNTTLCIAAKSVTSNQCVAAGCNPASSPYTNAQVDAIVEVDMSGTVVWEWCFFDHGIQDFDASKSNYVGTGKSISNYLGRLNLNLPGRPITNDWLHCNSIDYNTNLDQIVINAAGGEFYVIDHGNTFLSNNPAGSVALAASTNGDFIYRFGDPARYSQGSAPSIQQNWTTSTTGNKQIGGSSHAQWIPTGLPGAGQFLVYNNGGDLFETTPQSYIFQINGYLNATTNDTGAYVNPPAAGYNNWAAPGHDTDKRTKSLSRQVTWMYYSMANQGMFSHLDSSVQRLPNGNTLVCDSTEGHIFEVTSTGEAVWEYINPISTEGLLTYKRDNWPMYNALFRASRYATNHSAFTGRTLTPQATITGNTPSYISAPTISGTAQNPLLPAATNGVWVTANVTNSRAVASVTLTYIVAASPVTLTMLDDGAHQDGAAGDGRYGVMIPALPGGTVVSYYISSQDDFGNTSTDPTNAPTSTYSYAVQGGVTNLPPVITVVTNTPTAPTASDPVWVTANVTDDVSVASVILTYSTDSGTNILQTNTVFTETMGTNAVKPWTGSGCLNAWTVTGSNYFEQRSGANYGSGNTNGLEFKQGTTNLSDSMFATASGIDTRGYSGFVEFYLQSLTLTNQYTNAGWTFQLDAGSGYVTRLGELTSTNHGWTKYHYDLQLGELVSSLKMRFQFQSGATNNRIDLDQISVKVATSSSSSSTNVTLLDDGVHQDGVAGDGTYGGQIPALPVGTTVSYYLIATDSGGRTATNPVGAPNSTLSYTVITNTPSSSFYNVLLGRPTDHSVAISILSFTNLEVYIGYGTQSGVYTNQTATNSMAAGTPMVISLNTLTADQQYFYRLYYRIPGDTNFNVDLNRTFHTQRAPGNTFSFIIEADPHYLDNEPPVWQLALTNMLVDKPDFLIDLGDTFMGEKYFPTNSYTLSQPGIFEACKNVRQQFFSVSGHSLPLFLVNGNHDPELGWLLSSSAPTNNSAVWGDQAREFYYPCPIPGAFFSGSTNADPYLGGGVRDGYYAFNWGDALFVVLDNYWYTSQGTTNKSSDLWGWTLGTNQYQWLKRTLETSQAKFKFVFAHHLVGGSLDTQGRGGLAYASYVEWGGYNTNGTWGFDTRRPGWGMPIQSLLLSNGVNAFFHGHDHLFVKEDLDVNGDGKTDLVYQECPQPSRTNYNSTSAAPGYGYTNGVIQGNSGYLRVQVTPTNATVDYVRVFLPGDEGTGKTNRMVSYSYAFTALSISGTTNIPVAPTSTNSVWVTTRISGTTNVGQVTLIYDAGNGPTNVMMFDDGSHQDGTIGDGMYGAQIPAFPAGVTVRYYVRAAYELSRVTVDPLGAPSNTYAYTVLSPITVTPFGGSIVLGRPTDHSITVSVLSTNDQQMYLEYGASSGAYTNQTVVTNITAGQPLEVILSQLQSDTRYYYRLRYKATGNAMYLMDTEHTFHTQRAPGSTFTFSIQGDSHPERVNAMFNSNFYALTLLTAAADQPDFYLTIGDDFSVDNIPTNLINGSLVTECYTLQRPYLGLVGNSAPLFLVNGNHEQAAAYLLDGTSNNIAVWAQNARNLYYPEPAPDGFYTGNTNSVPFIGLLKNYFAWTWGDALFVTIDPYWADPICVDNNYWTGVKRTNLWDVTHGDSQYEWLKTTLEQSKAKYKFVFAHHVLGTGRGGTDEAVLYEWGGQNLNQTWGFTTNRPGWPVPIHQLMVANNVTAFVQGHDHIWVQQQLDGVTYQTLPNPADPNYSLFNSDAFTNNLVYKTNNTGYTRFTVAPSGVKVDYVRTILPTNQLPNGLTNGAPSGVTNGTIDYSYTIYPLLVSGTTNIPSAPVATNTVWVTSAVIGGTNISQVTLTYIIGTNTNTVTMLDDGLHQDSAAGDGIYGGQIPAFPVGTTVRYFVRARDAATRQITDPSGAPINTNLFTYTVSSASTVSWSMLKLPDTGQTNSFTATFGEDSDYTINPPSFTDNGDGTVKDNVTGLTWQKADGGEMTWSNAFVYAQTNRVGSQSDWRLPTSHEAFSILNQGKVNPSLDTNYFTPSTAQYWWTRDPLVGDPTHVWAINAGGGIGAHWQTETLSAGGTNRYHVRCVRGATAPTSQPIHHFTNNANGTVTDLDTGLTWQQAEVTPSMNWESALQYAEGLSLGSYSDWRLPSIKELQSINDETLSNPSLSTNYFPGAQAARYWSSTTVINLTNRAWWVDFQQGLVSYDDKTTNLYVRCVRGGTTNATSTTNSFTPLFARIPAGQYVMGDHFGFIDPAHPSDEVPLHNVYVDAFYMGVTHVTCLEYVQFLNSALAQGLIEVRSNYVYGVGGTNIYCDTYGSETNSRVQWSGSAFTIRDNRDLHPITGMRWFGAIAYCNWASARDGYAACYDLATGACDLAKNGYRLPTEAEWEYAARGGLYSPYGMFPWGSETNADGTIANWAGSGDPFESGPTPCTTPVGFYNGSLQYKTNYNWPGTNNTYQTRNNTNGFGLADMSGNVWQLINDWYTSDYYTNCIINNIVTNPPGPVTGSTMPDGQPYRGIRGGNWYNGQDQYGHGRVSNRNPSYYRGPGDPNGPWYHVGFRVMRRGYLSVIASGATLTSLTNGLHFTEGPAADAAGNIFFSDVTSNLIYRWSLAGQLSMFRTNSGGANGLKFDRSGNLLVCEGGNGRLTSITMQSNVTVLASTYGGQRFNEPNDLWVDPAGGVYFSDPVYFGHPVLQGGEYVYYLSPDRSIVTRVITDMVRPNGLVGTPDGKTLYVADWGATNVFRYTINTNGTLTNKTLFARVKCDGMTLDSEGNLYLTETAVLVYDSTGQQNEQISVPERPTNLAFGGSDRKTLFITTDAGSLYSLSMRVQGVLSGTVTTNLPPVITSVTNTPIVPTASDPVWITANVTDDVSVATVTLTYTTGTGGGASQTNAVFTETMGTNTVKPWTGAGASYAWTVTGNYFEQRSGANYGTGNTNGMEFKQGTTNLTDSMIATTNSIDARGTSGFVEFWMQTLTISNQYTNAGWTFQLDAGTGYVTRLSELTSANHGWQLYHYDLQVAELVNSLKMRFQFRSGETNSRMDLDQISVKVVTSGSSYTNVTMLDDGLHQDGVSGDHVYGGQVPALAAGTTIRYYVTATDSGSLMVTNPSGAPGVSLSYTVQSGPSNPPPVIANTAISPATPYATNFVWVTAQVTDNVSVAQVVLTYNTGSGLTNVTMLDDGAHQDGVAGDGIYGGQIPVFPAGTAVTYYLSATDNLGATATDPSGAPGTTRSYIVLSGSTTQTMGLFLNTTNAWPGYTLMAPMHHTNTYLINNAGEVVHTWKSAYEPGRAAYLMTNGHMFRAGMVMSGGPSTGGGEGGRVEEFDWDGNLVWAIDYYSSTYIHHHDFKVLPNGNVLLLVAEKKTLAEVIAAGFNTNLLDASIFTQGYMLPDCLVEVTPTRPYGGTVVWEWHLWDHMIQDYDTNKNNYGVVFDHPELIDVNGPGIKIPQFWNHVNGIDYNVQLDQVMLSIRGNSEVFIVDHQLTTAQAASHAGGRYSKGGDILYRWGDPEQYNRGTSANRILYQQHHTHWIDTNCPGAGNILIFNNGIGRGYSTVNEIVPPVDAAGNYTLLAGQPFGPSTNYWVYMATPPTNFYSTEISGAQRLPNGNTLICEGIKGNLFEVTPAGQMVWRYLCPVSSVPMAQGDTIPVDPARPDQLMTAVFRVDRYGTNYAGLVGRDLTPQGAIERLVLPSLTIQPQSQTVGLGSNTTLTVTASGSALLSYQWYKTGIAITNATNAVLGLGPLTLNDAGSYYCLVTNQYGSATSSNAVLTVTNTTPSRIIALGGNLAFGNVLVGSNAQRTLWITNSGSAVLNVSNVSCPSGFSGAWSGTLAASAWTNVTITFNPTGASNYSGNLVVTSDATNNNNALAISGTGAMALTITLQPFSQTNLVGTMASFSVTATGTLPLNYQWYKSVISNQWTVISDATNATLNLGPLVLGDAGSYSCLASNLYGSTNSSNVVLTVFQPLSVAVQGSGSVTYSPTNYNYGSTVILTATPANWYQFVRWTDGSSANPRAIVIRATNNYTALFTNSVPLEQRVINNVTNWVPVGMPLAVIAGQVVLGPTNLSIPATGAVQVAWSSSWSNASIYYTLDGSDPEAYGADYYGPFTISNATTLRAIAYNWSTYVLSMAAEPIQIVFTPVCYAKVETTGGGTLQLEAGTNLYTGLTLNQFFATGSLVTVTATPASGWTFLYWTGNLSGTNPVRQLTLTSNFSATAVFGTRLTTLVVSTNGTIQVDPVQPIYPFGTVTHLMGVPNAGQFFNYWSNSPWGAISNNSVRYVVTNAMPSFTAVFGTAPPRFYTLTTLVSGDGEVSQTPSALLYANGQSVSLVATPNTNQAFVAWSGNTNGAIILGNTLTVTMNPSRVITANFCSPLFPQITRQPQSSTNLVGTTVSLSLGVSGMNPLAYQWLFNGTNLTGATNATLTITNLGLNHTGSYQARATNAYGEVISLPTSLVVNNLAVVSVTNVLPSQGQFGFQFAPETHRAYWLEYKTNLGQPNWIVLPGITNATGTQVLLDRAATNKARFYRLGSALVP